MHQIAPFSKIFRGSMPLLYQHPHLSLSPNKLASFFVDFAMNIDISKYVKLIKIHFKMH